MFKEFKQFLFRGNIIELAVAVMIGASFGSVVTALVSDLLTPFFAAMGRAPNFANLYFTINNSKFMYGHFLNSIVSFILLAIAIYFLIVKPLNMLMSRMNNNPSGSPVPSRKCSECLSEIPLEARRCAHCGQLVK